MTEAEWLACDDPLAVIQAAGDRATGRKVRLFCVACCRQVLPLAPAARQKSANAILAVAERFADGDATKAERVAAEKKARNTYPMVRFALAATCTPTDAFYAARHAGEFATHGPKGVRYEATQAALAGLARDIVGPPAPRRIGLDPKHRTPAVIGLARGMYETGDLGPLPVLAAALEEAGCSDAAVLGHCRSTEPHVRGCWVVDLVLGNE